LFFSYWVEAPDFSQGSADFSRRGRKSSLQKGLQPWPLLHDLPLQELRGAAKIGGIIRGYMNNKSTVLIFACLFLGTAVYAAKEDVPSPETLISRARLLEDIWTEGTPPMLMRADVQVLDAKGSFGHAGYTFVWISPSRWREEIQFGNYARLRIRDAKGYWQKTALNYQPEIIFQLDTLLHVKNLLSVGSKQTLGKVKNREKNGVREKCTEVKWTTGTERILCFDEAGGALVSVEYPRGERQNPPEISRIEYGAFNTVEGKSVPYEIRAMQDRKLILAIKVLEMTKATQENPAIFNVPADAEFWTQCGDMPPAELVERTQPRYPPSARTNREYGRVILYAVIEPDGSLSHFAIIQGATPTLDAATYEAVRHWRYKPQLCGQTSVRSEISIATDFWLER
jgi:TonB family protein